MKSFKKLIIFLLMIFILSLTVVGCSSEADSLKAENAKLKDKISQLEKSIYDLKRAEEKVNDAPLAINYVEPEEKVRFIEKENYILALPQIGSEKMRPVYPNTLAAVCDKALVNNEYWLFIRIPTYDSPCNNKGWIKESDTVAYTKDKVSLLQSDVEIKAGSEVYETSEFKDIKNTVPQKLSMQDSGRLQEKKDGFCRISQAGGKDIWVKESSIIYPEVNN